MRISFFGVPIVLLALSTTFVPVSASTGQAVFGQGQPLGLEDLPPGRAKSHLESLPAPAQKRALIWLQSFSFPEQDLESLQFDEEGGVFYADTHTVDNADIPEEATVTETEAIAAEDTFLLHSRPNATKIVFLDFDGHTITGTAWNSGRVDPFNALPFDIDNSPGTFNTDELTRIQEIWHRVAEDLAPFDIDVTTEDPGSFGATTGRILITHSTDANNNNMPASSGGGVAYVGVWGRSDYPYYSPALVYYNNLGGGFPPYVAEAASHELGHNLSLSHDGRGDPYNESYYQGHGPDYVSWAPIMGVGYYSNVTQWSRGEYEAANNTEDDLDLISSKLAYRSDDHGDSISNATPLIVEADGSILVTTPETDNNPQSPSSNNKGVIESGTDVDMFFFNAGTGPIDITIDPAWAAFYRDSLRGANLDIFATLYDLSGAVVTTSDPLDETNAQISTTLTEGSYYLAIDGTGNTVSPYSDYTSLGQYFISGTITPSGVVVDRPLAPNGLTASAISHTQIDLTWTDNATNETGYFVERSTDQANWTQLATLSQNSISYNDTGLNASTTYFYQVKAFNSVGDTVSNIASETTQAQPTPPTEPSNVTAIDGTDATAIVSWADNSDDETSFEVQRETLHKKRNVWQSSTIVGTVTANTTQLTDASGTGIFRYRVRTVNEAGASVWSPWAEVTVTDISNGGGGNGGGKCNPKKGC